MRVAVECLDLDRESTSIGLFERSLLSGLLHQNTEVEFTVIVSGSGSAPKWARPQTEIRRIPSLPRPLQILLLSTQAASWHLEAYLATFNLAPKLPKNTRLALVSHDFSHGTMAAGLPERVTGTIYRQLHVRSIRSAEVVLANSEFTASQVREVATPAQEIRVVYHDCHPDFKLPAPEFHESLRRNLGIGQFRFLLSVGRVHPLYKNISTLLRAFEQFSKVHPEFKMIIVSNDKLRKADMKYIADRRLTVLTMRNISREMLRSLYASAELCVYPSKYEGFGAPILEAQNSGCPIIVNNAPPMTEVAGSGALYFDGTVESLFNQMCRLVSNPADRSQAVSAGKINALRFDWNRTAHSVLECLTEFSRS